MITSKALEERRHELKNKGYCEADKILYKSEHFDPLFINSWPVIYITTPCLNSFETINQTIRSIVSQSGNFSIRYHIQDGGSHDGTLQKLEEWGHRLEEGSFGKCLLFLLVMLPYLLIKP